MITRRLTAPLQAALAAASQALAASPDAGDDEEWIVPAGAHAVAGPLSLGRAGRALSLRGPGPAEATLTLTGGTLQLGGGAADVQDLTIAGDGVETVVEVVSGRVHLESLRLSGRAAGACTALVIGGDVAAVDIEDVAISGVEGAGNVRGAHITAATEVRGSGLRVERLTGAAVVGIDVVAGEVELSDVTVQELVGSGAVVGVEVAGASRIDLAEINAATLTGAGAVAVRALQGGTGEGTLSLVDLEVSAVEGGAGEAVGLIAGAAGALRVRGFSVAGVRGVAAMGVLGLAGRGLELGIGEVRDVVGGPGGAAGVRVVATPAMDEVVVRDVAVARVAAAPVPLDARPPRDDDDNPRWRTWAGAAVDALANATSARLALPPFPGGAADVSGLHVEAVVDELAPLLDVGSPGAIQVQDGSIRTVSGTALQIDGGLRAALVRHMEAHTALFAGWIQAEEVLLAELTWHRHGAGLHFGPGDVRAYDALFSGIAGAAGNPFVRDEDTDLDAVFAVFVPEARPPFRELGPLPYVSAGAAELPAALAGGALPASDEAIDLRLLPGAAVADAAVPVPGDGEAPDGSDVAVAVGAYPPPRPSRCELRDPLPRPFAGGDGADGSTTLVDYRARDAKSLLAVMLERARVSMSPWSDRSAADFTTMMFETLAASLDQLAYEQERSVAEGFLSDARLRRSVEDHVRALDYQPDPGLSASVMIRFRLDGAALDDLVAARLEHLGSTALPPGTGRFEFLTDGGIFEIPGDTLVANASAVEQSVVFATDEPLPWFPELDQIRLGEDVLPGATEMRLRGVLPHVEIGRWLVLYRGRGEPGHVVRATTVAFATDSTLVGWDPRRPSPARFRAEDDVDGGESAAAVLGNVVPAQHGLPLSRADVAPDDGNPVAEANADPMNRPEPFEATLLPWQKLLAPIIDGSRTRELHLPFSPVSIQMSGYPFPGERRQGRAMLRASVEGDPWRLVDDLALHGPGEEVFVLRSAPEGGDNLRFGDGVNGSALPARQTGLQIELRVGRGKLANVGESVLSRILNIPRRERRPGAVADLWAQSMDDLRRLIKADNPLPGVGGREPEGIEQIRYRAPFGVAQGLSAVTPADYVRLLLEMPEVAGANARVRRLGVRHVVRVTVLLRDEDTLDADERLRRWALVRSNLESIRLLGFDVETVPPTWVPLDLDVSVDAHPYAQADLLKDAVEASVTGQGGLLDPDVSGLGGDLHLADLYRAITTVPGVAAARVLRFRRLEPRAPERLEAGVIAIGAEEVAVVRGPQRRSADGLLTVAVCGGLR